MDFMAPSADDPLPLPSLRLLVPPVQLMMASMWRVLKRRDVSNYWKVAEYVSLVVDMVPELLLHKQRKYLNMGLRARYILELCRCEQPTEPNLVLSYIEQIKQQHPASSDTKDSNEEIVQFLELVNKLLKDPKACQDFFKDFHAEYGAQYDNDLQLLFSEFLYRLGHLLPVPDLDQIVSWLETECPVLDDCVHTVAAPQDLMHLLQHHKRLGHLEQHVPPSSMGDKIFSTLSAVSSARGANHANQSNQPHLQQTVDQPASSVEDVAFEVIAVTDCAEVELDTSGDSEAAMVESCPEGGERCTVEREDCLLVLPNELIGPGEVTVEASQDEPQGRAAPGSTLVATPGDHQSDLPSRPLENPPGPHDCPKCKKKFKFASSLIAHRVIHTGERPHRCSHCGRCFSFRQSLERHRQTHRSAREYDCSVCGKTFHSLSARGEHEAVHAEGSMYTCNRCPGTFSSQSLLANHLESHAADPGANQPPEVDDKVGEEVRLVATSGCQVLPDGAQVAADSAEVEGRTGPTSEVDDSSAAAPKVRTSGRKRRPTMKVQVINLQKCTTSTRQQTNKRSSPKLKPLPLNCVEHSYGSSPLSTKDSDTSSGQSAAFACPKCSFHHMQETEVQRHIDSAHSLGDESAAQTLPDQEGTFACPDCDKSFRFQSLLKAHQRSHTGEQPFLCPQCGRRFSFKQSLERHKQTHKPGRRHRCLICGESFDSLEAEREHRSAHMENGEYLCSECGRAFAWKSALVRHLKTHGKDAGEAAHTHKCPRCDLAFSCASYLNKHLQTHREERAHACSCGKSFAYRAALTAHQRVHQKERPHVCAQCGKGFLYRGGLLNHMKIHSEDMPFMCSFCGKSFKRERNMKKHERCHTRENVFACSQCDKSFVYKATLVRHQLTHSGERPYLCSDCGKGFFSHAELLKHERFHTGHKPFECPHCGKRFTQSCYLTIHLRYHTGARPYPCTECDKSFLSANRLKRHQRTHSAEKPYVCAQCGKGFRQSYNLKMHERTHYDVHVG